MATDARPTVALLHGVGLDRTMWSEVEPLLEAAGLEVRSLDLLGHGSAAPAREGLTLSDLAEDVARRLEPGTHVVGFSLGALVAQHLAVHHPDLVATLVSVSSVCDRTPEERAAVEGRLATATSDLAASADAAIERWYSGTDVPDEVRAATRSTLQANDPESYLACYTVFARADAEIAPSLQQISAPSLAITGRDDGGSTPEMSERLAARIPDCTVLVLEDVRHMLPVQAPDALATAIITMIRQHTGVEET